MDTEGIEHTVRIATASPTHLSVSVSGVFTFAYDPLTQRAVEGEYHDYIPAGAVLEHEMLADWLEPHMNPLYASFVALEVCARLNTIHNIYMLIDEDYARWKMLAQMSGSLFQD